MEEIIRNLPKVELHAHLNGCIRESTLIELANERGVTLPPHFGFCQDNHPTSQDPPNGSYINSKPRSLENCFDIFVQIGQVVSDLEALRRITFEALQDFALHQVVYLELRTTPKILLRTPFSSERCTKEDYITTVLSVIQEWDHSHQYALLTKEDGTSCMPLQVRLLLSIDRAQSREEAEDTITLAIKMCNKKSDTSDSSAILSSDAINTEASSYIVGIDLGGNPFRNHFSDFTDSLETARQAGLKITLHCGEVRHSNVLGENVTESNLPLDLPHESNSSLTEIEHIINFRPDRLGHALWMPSSLRPILESHPIPVEVCPTSNVMTLELATSFQGNLVEGLRRHPQLEYWLKEGYPISISTDDPGVFHTDPTKEWILLVVTFNMNVAQIKRIILESLDHAFCDDSLKKSIRESILSYFQQIDVMIEKQ